MFSSCRLLFISGLLFYASSLPSIGAEGNPEEAHEVWEVVQFASSDREESGESTGEDDLAESDAIAAVLDARSAEEVEVSPVSYVYLAGRHAILIEVTPTEATAAGYVIRDCRLGKGRLGSGMGDRAEKTFFLVDSAGQEERLTWATVKGSRANISLSDLDIQLEMTVEKIDRARGRNILNKLLTREVFVASPEIRRLMQTGVEPDGD